MRPSVLPASEHEQLRVLILKGHAACRAHSIALEQNDRPTAEAAYHLALACLAAAVEVATRAGVDIGGLL